MIDFATTGPGHGLADLAKLIVSCIGNYVPPDAEGKADERAAFEAVCRTVAAAPGTGCDYPKTSGAPPYTKRLEDALGLLWPQCRAMDPHCVGVASDVGDGHGGLPSCTAIVFAIMRHAVRLCTFVQTKRAGTLRRFLYLSCACAQRLLHEANGTACGWLAAARARWTEVAPECAPPAASPRDALQPYLAAVCESEAWLVDPVSFSKADIHDACIHVQLEHLTGPARRLVTRTRTGGDGGERNGKRLSQNRTRTQVGGMASRFAMKRSSVTGPGFPTGSASKDAVPRGSVQPAARRLSASSGELSAGLREIFPTGLPQRVLVVGTGGTGKTVLTQQAPKADPAPRSQASGSC
jgi:hypothetical protein